MKAKKTPNSRAYTGHSGQMAVMAELLFRECNVAIPEVDVGTDVFAFLDDSEEVARIQVKTAQGKRYKGQEGYRAQFDLPMKQLKRYDRPRLYYVLAVRLPEKVGDENENNGHGKWESFLVMSRPDLKGFWNCGLRFATENPTSGNLVLSVQFRQGGVRCGGVDLTRFLNAWDTLPPFRPLTDAT